MPTNIPKNCYSLSELSMTQNWYLFHSNHISRFSSSFSTLKTLHRKCEIIMAIETISVFRKRNWCGLFSCSRCYKNQAKDFFPFCMFLGLLKNTMSTANKKDQSQGQNHYQLVQDQDETTRTNVVRISYDNFGCTSLGLVKRLSVISIFFVSLRYS